LLAVAGFRFSIRAKPVEEVRRAGENPVEYARRLARAKAEAAWERPEEIILGADTIVVLDGRVLEKPSDANDARAMLRLLSGREHTVITGICLLHERGAVIDHSATRVGFAVLSESEIGYYVASGEPMDKAGAYAIQGLAARFADRVEGDYFNVVGLPLSLVYRHLKELGCPI